ncbi:hypothetical protein E1297_07235 [Roseibium sp. RKSG952]|nr:hypothetical protein [Roseibium sp. RKSG952]
MDAQPGLPDRPVILVLDNGPVHTSKLSRKALADLAHWMTVEWLPRYAPELNDIEPVWKSHKQTELAHQTFADARELEAAIKLGVENWNAEQINHPWGRERISA